MRPFARFPSRQWILSLGGKDCICCLDDYAYSSTYFRSLCSGGSKVWNCLLALDGSLSQPPNLYMCCSGRSYIVICRVRRVLRSRGGRSSDCQQVASVLDNPLLRPYTVHGLAWCSGGGQNSSAAKSVIHMLSGFTYTAQLEVWKKGDDRGNNLYVDPESELTSVYSHVIARVDAL